MSPYWTDLVRRLSPYVPGEQRAGESVVKLNTNENPYPPSPHVVAAVQQTPADALRRYPDPEAGLLRDALASYHALSPEQVFVGNGSDEVLALSFMGFFTDGQPLAFPAISYSFYPVYCDLLAIESRRVELRADFSLNLADVDGTVGGVVFPNPNAPTGCAVSRADIEALLMRYTRGVVLVDEAYADFGAESAIDLVERHPNLLVCRTFSKGRSLAGMRVGAAFGAPPLIDALNRVKNSFNSYPLDAVAQRAAIASLADESYYRSTLAAIVSTRERTIDGLLTRGFRCLPSAANFVFAAPPARADSPTGAAAALFESLGREGVLVRHWSTPLLEDWLRISIGSDSDMERLFDVVDRS